MPPVWNEQDVATIYPMNAALNVYQATIGARSASSVTDWAKANPDAARIDLQMHEIEMEELRATGLLDDGENIDEIAMSGGTALSEAHRVTPDPASVATAAEASPETVLAAVDNSTSPVWAIGSNETPKYP